MASTYLSRTTNSGSTGTKWTLSAWVKRANTGGNNCIWNQSNDANSTTYNEVAIKSANELDVQIRNGTSGNNGTYIRRRTSRLFRDCNAFYHIVVRYDSTDNTAGNRLRLYVNGVEETSMQESVGTVPQNQVTVMATSGADQTFGRGVGSSNHYWDGVISYAILCDGYSYAPSEFGETDSTTGEWKIKVDPSVSYGTNGWWILKDGNSITDQSGKGNNWTLSGGTLTDTKDCPSNVFATLNVLERLGGSITISNGNTQFFNQASDWRTIISNLAFPNTGKFYAEMQVNEVSSAVQVGIMAQSSFVSNFQADLGTQGQYNGYAYLNTGQKRTNNSASNYGGSFSGGIIGIAVDMDNKNIYFSKDGTWQNSGNPESGATGTGAAFTDLQIDKDYCFAVASQGSNPKVSWNFGNGFFGTSAVADNSTATASTPGVFNYAVPTGYQPLSTKGLNT